MSVHRSNNFLIDTCNIRHQIIDNRLGSPDPSLVPVGLKPENMCNQLLKKREIDYVTDNLAPLSCRAAISDAHNHIYPDGHITPDNIMVTGGQPWRQPLF